MCFFNLAKNHELGECFMDFWRCSKHREDDVANAQQNIKKKIYTKIELWKVECCSICPEI